MHLCIETGRLAEAEQLQRRAIAIDEKSFGLHHPSVARSLNNLARVLKVANRLSEAEPLYRRAVEIDTKNFGPHDSRVAGHLNNLAQLLKASDRLPEAELLLRHVVEILALFTRNTGHRHPHAQDAVVNYVGLLLKMGRSREQIQAALREIAPDFFQS